MQIFNLRIFPIVVAPFQVELTVLLLTIFLGLLMKRNIFLSLFISTNSVELIPICRLCQSTRRIKSKSNYFFFKTKKNFKKIRNLSFDRIFELTFDNFLIQKV